MNIEHFLFEYVDGTGCRCRRKNEFIDLYLRKFRINISAMVNDKSLKLSCWKICLGAFAVALGRLLAWTLGFLALISLIAWLNPDESGSPTVPDWAKVVVWAQFIVPVIPAVSAGVARLKGSTKWRPIMLGAVFGLMGPIVGVASLVALFVPIGFNVDVGFPDDRVPDLVILVALLSVCAGLGVATALWRARTIREH